MNYTRRRYRGWFWGRYMEVYCSDREIWCRVGNVSPSCMTFFKGLPRGSEK